MTLRDVGGAVIYLGGLAFAVTAIAGLVKVTVVNPLRKRIREEIAVALNRHQQEDHNRRDGTR